MNLRPKYHLLILLVVFSAISIQAQSPSKKQKKFEKKKEQRVESQKELEEKLIKRHLKLQSKETRKRIKRNKKLADRRNMDKNPTPFFRRILIKKRRR